MNLQLDKVCSTSHCASSGVRIANLCQTVGKLLQDILDLIATASSDTERKILDDWKHRASRMQSKACFGSAEAQPMLRYANALLSQYTVVYDVAHATGMADMEHMFLTLKGRSLRNGASFTSSVPLYGATDLKPMQEPQRGSQLGPKVQRKVPLRGTWQVESQDQAACIFDALAWSSMLQSK